MQYVKLPPAPLPKHPTARRASRSLGDHLKSFLNANNLNGFIEPTWDDEPVAEPEPKQTAPHWTNGSIREILLFWATADKVHIERLKKWVKILKKNSNKTLKHWEAYDLLARAMGYQFGHELLAIANQNEGYIPRLRTVDDLIRSLTGADTAA